MSGKLQPALLGGLFIGVLSTLPYVSRLNGCCCLWVITGGVLAIAVIVDSLARRSRVTHGRA